MWTIELFGSLRAVREDREVTRFRSRQTADLLAYLGYFRHQRHRRDTLVEMLWPDTNQASGRVSLNTALSSLRRELEGGGGSTPLLLTDRHTVALDPEQVCTDVSLFEGGLTAAAAAPGREARVSQLAEALRVYGGELLAGHFEPWILPESRRLESLFQQSLDDLVQLLVEMGDLNTALQHAQRGVSFDPLCEAAHERLIRVLIALGLPAAALQQYQDLERLLRQELDAAPGPRLRGLEGEIRSGLAYVAPSNPIASPREFGPAAGDRRWPSPPGSDRTAAPSLSSELEPPRGAVPLQSPYYIERATDAQLCQAIQRRESIVLIKGARQMGKTSLLARGLDRARTLGARVVTTGFQCLNESQLSSPESLFQSLAHWIAEQLELPEPPDLDAIARFGPNLGFQRFLRRVLRESPVPLVWAVDEADRLFHHSWGCEVFALFRALFNERALTPAAASWKLTLVIAYSTEAHLFIPDNSLSPFNVGTQLVLEDFTQRDVVELNRRHGSPLRSDADVEAFHHLFGGQPFLVRRALYELAGGARELSVLTREAAAGGERLFGEHLRGIYQSLAQAPELRERIGALLLGTTRPTESELHRLRNAGLMVGTSSADARARCALYEHYLRGLREAGSGALRA